MSLNKTENITDIEKECTSLSLGNKTSKKRLREIFPIASDPFLLTVRTSSQEKEKNKPGSVL